MVLDLGDEVDVWCTLGASLRSISPILWDPSLDPVGLIPDFRDILRLATYSAQFWGVGVYDKFRR